MARSMEPPSEADLRNFGVVAGQRFEIGWVVSDWCTSAETIESF